MGPRMRLILLLPAALALLSACAQEEEPVADKYERTEAAIANKARAFEAEVENEVGAIEARLENETDALLNAARDDAAEGNAAEAGNASAR